MSYTLIRGSFYLIWWPYDIFKQFDPYSTPADPNRTFDPSNALRFSQKFFPPNLMVIEHFLSNLTPVDPSWFLHGLWPQQCTTLWSGVRILTKFGSYRAFLRQIDSWMTFDPSWDRFEIMPTNLLRPPPTPCQILVRYRILAVLSNLIPVYPRWPLYDVWPQQCTTLWSGVLTKCGSHRTF